MIRILIVEDQSLLRGALETLLALEEDIEVVAKACDGLSALRILKKNTVDVLVTDIEMPNMGGIDLAEQVRKDFPDMRVLVVTTFARPGYLQRAMQAGVIGYVLKDAPSDELADAVRRVARGQVCVTAELTEAAWSASTPLSDRERQILRLAEAGKTNREIGVSLNLSPGTVRNYLAEATRKLGVANRIEAFRVARENGWL